MPAVAVFGIGATVAAVPPVAVVYQFNPVPVALKAVAVAFWQYVTGLVAIGAVGKAFTVTVIVALGPAQVFVVWLT